MANNFWFKFAFKDWLADVRLLSLSARGLLIELIIYMRECDPPGTMPADVRLIVRLTGCTTEEINFALSELREHGILDFENTPAGEIMKSRRIAKEFHKSRVNSENGKKGGNPRLSKSVKRSHSDSVNQKDNRIPNSDFNSISISKEKGMQGEKSNRAFLETQLEQLRNSPLWIDTVRKNNGLTLEEFTTAFEDFAGMVLEKDQLQSAGPLKSYFSNWYQQRKRNTTADTKKTASGGDIKKSYETW